MADHIIKLLLPQPGIQRDGTQFNSNSWTDGSWVRFYMNLPTKMGGQQIIDPGGTEITRNIFMVPQQPASGEGTVDIYFGRPSSLTFINFTTSPTGLSGTEIDRTPEAFVADPNNVWDFALFTVISDTPGDSTSYIVAQAAPNATNLNNSIEGQVYYGDILTTTALIPVQDSTSAEYITCSGGIVAVGPFLVTFDNNGLIRWCAVGDITSWPTSNILQIAGTKILQGVEVKGGGTPSALFWSTNTLIKVSFDPTIGDSGSFVGDVVGPNISLLSPDSIIVYNQVYYWIGNNQFYYYNGVVRRLDNNMNRNYFFNNINIAEQEKVWGIAFPDYDELWWFSPQNGSIECNTQFVYNVTGEFWFDNMLSRCCGYYSSTFPYPVLCDANLSPDLTVAADPPTLTYAIWMQEFGFNSNQYNYSFAIYSAIESNVFCLADMDQQSDRQIRTRRVIPDFIQVGEMNLIIYNRDFPNDTPVASSVYVFDPTTNKIDIDGSKSMGSLVTYRFESNTNIGFYQMGKIWVYYEIGDRRPGN